MKRTTRWWILRGLTASCLSEIRLYGWYVENVPAKERVTAEPFQRTMAELWFEGLIYVQRSVPAVGSQATGWALTDNGIAAEREQGN